MEIKRNAGTETVLRREVLRVANEMIEMGKRGADEAFPRVLLLAHWIKEKEEGAVIENKHCSELRPCPVCGFCLTPTYVYCHKCGTRIAWKVE